MPLFNSTGGSIHIPAEAGEMCTFVPHNTINHPEAAVPTVLRNLPITVYNVTVLVY